MAQPNGLSRLLLTSQIIVRSDSPHFMMSQNTVIHKSLVNAYLSLKHLHTLLTTFFVEL